MILDDILAHNRTFVQETKPEALSAEPRRRACVVACMDSRLVDFLTRALGVGRGEVDLISTAGNTITRHDNAVLRSVAVSVILHHIKEVLVVGHTNCGMATDVLPFTEAMEVAGISRSDVGPVDLREFFGFIATPEANVRQVVDTLRRSPVIPPEVVIHGLVLDVRTGALAVVVRGEAGAPRPRAGRAAPLPEVDLDRARAPEVRVSGERAEPVAVLLGPAAPVPPPAVLLRPGPAVKPEAREVDIVLGPTTRAPQERKPTAKGPVAPPPPTPSPVVTINVSPAPGPKRARDQARRPRPSKQPNEKGDLDITLGPAGRAGSHRK